MQFEGFILPSCFLRKRKQQKHIIIILRKKEQLQSSLERANQETTWCNGIEGISLYRPKDMFVITSSVMPHGVNFTD